MRLQNNGVVAIGASAPQPHAGRSVREVHMARFPTIRNTYFMKLLSWDERFRTRDSIADLLEEFLRRSDLALLGFSAPRQLLRDISLSEVPALFKPEISRHCHNFLFGEPQLRLGITWEDSDWVDKTDCSERLAIIVSIEEDDIAFAKQQFLLLCELTSPFWAELNNKEITRKVTFSGPKQHMCCLPLFGRMNYLGSDYVSFLGKDSIVDAGFDSVEPCHKGLLTTINADTPEAFTTKQTDIRGNLGGDSVFGDWRQHTVPHFETREQHVSKYRDLLPPMEFTVTPKGLKKKVISPPRHP